MLRIGYFNLLTAVGLSAAIAALSAGRLNAAEDPEGKDALEKGNTTLAEAKSRREATRKAEDFTGPKSPLDILQGQPMDKVTGTQRTKVNSTFMGEADPRDFHMQKFEPWSLNAGDFVYDKPALVIFQDGDSIVQVYVALTYTITNSTTRTLRIKPNFTMLSGHYYTKPPKDESLELRFLNNYRSYVRVISAVDGAPPIGQADFDKLNDTRLEKLMGWSQYSNLTADLYKILTHYQLCRDLKGDPANGNNWDIKAYEYKPGEVKHGVALFPMEDTNMQTMRILVEGLTNAHYTDRAMYDQLYSELQDPNYAMYNVPMSSPRTLRRVLDLRFKRTEQTGFDLSKTTFDFIAQRWDKVWDPLGDMTILSEMPKPVEMNGFFEGAAKHPLWHVKWKITNNTERSQEIRIDNMYYNVKVAFDYKGEKMSFWVRILDDGNLSIFKDAYLKQNADLAGSPDEKTWYDRYHFFPRKDDDYNKMDRQFRDPIELQPVTPETRGQDNPNSSRTSCSIFDAHDIDWDDAFLKVTIALSRKIDPEKETEKMIGNIQRTYPNPNNLTGTALAKELTEKGLLLYNPKFTFAGMDGGDPQKDIDEVKKLIYDAVVASVNESAAATTPGKQRFSLSMSTVTMGPKAPDRFEGMKNSDPLGEFIGAGVKTKTFYLFKRTPVNLKDVFSERDKLDQAKP